jgi:hypothetical protein
MYQLTSEASPSEADGTPSASAAPSGIKRTSSGHDDILAGRFAIVPVDQHRHVKRQLFPEASPPSSVSASAGKASSEKAASSKKQKVSKPITPAPAEALKALLDAPNAVELVAGVNLKPRLMWRSPLCVVALVVKRRSRQ